MPTTTQDIFGRDTSNIGGVFTADRAKLIFGTDLAALVQQLNCQYAQSITRLYEVGGPNIYLIGGRTQGNMGLNRVIGPKSTVMCFYAKYGNVCNARNNLINLQLQETDCSATNSGNFIAPGGAAVQSAGNAQINCDLKNCVITNVGFGVNAEQMIISDNTALMFTSLGMDTSGCSSTANASGG